MLAVAGILIIVSTFSSCDLEQTTIGDGIIGGEPFVTDRAIFDVFTFNRKIEAVPTNQIPVYQLGVYTDPIYGRTEASITSQVQLMTPNPTFGNLSASAEISNAFDENETIDSVFVYIPYINNQIDTDNDGVVDALDDAPTDPSNDSDGDTLSNSEEQANNTDPLNPDTDGDGERDDVDDFTFGDRFAERFRLDSIFYDNRRVENELAPAYLGESFNFKVERSTFFLRDLDPSTNFLEAQEFFSNQQFSPDFTEEVFFDGSVTISDREILFVVQEDDPDTDDDEEGSISSKLDPGIYVKLNDIANTFFQENILNKEGGSELLSVANFNEFFRGIHMSATPTSEDILFLLDLSGARINIFYSHDVEGEDTTEREQQTLDLTLLTQLGANAPLSGNAVNTFTNEAYPPEITNSIDTDENASKIYLKGGSGSFAEVKLFGEDDETAETIINQIRANNWIINEANLVFYVDRDAVPVSAIEPPRLYLYNAETNAPLYNILTENNSSDTPLGVFLNYDGILEESENQGLRYTVKITEYLNNIIVRDSTNASLGLSITPDLRIVGANTIMLPGGVERDLPAASILSPLGTVLFGSNFPDEEPKKLKLEIFFTETN